MAGVFRKRWFPRRNSKFDVGSGVSNCDVSLVGLSATAEINADQGTDDGLVLAGLAATSQLAMFEPTVVNGVNDSAVARTFIITGLPQVSIETGVTLYPTSEDITLSDNPYIIGSSQFYTIGAVYWDGEKKVIGVDWQFVEPFTHIIELLVDTSTISTPVTLIYYRWDIRVQSGFRVTDYPVSFMFNDTSIVAERLPPVNSFFTVSFTATRPGINPVTLMARYPEMVDDLLGIHTLYDGSSGFESYRPNGYRVFDLSDNNVYTWTGTMWVSSGMYADDTLFYVKRWHGIYQFDGTTVNLVFAAGDTIDGTYPETLEYPLFGEGIGKNLLMDGFSDNADVDFPAAYEVSQKPGYFDDWTQI